VLETTVASARKTGAGKLVRAERVLRSDARVRAQKKMEIKTNVRRRDETPRGAGIARGNRSALLLNFNSIEIRESERAGKRKVESARARAREQNRRYATRDAKGRPRRMSTTSTTSTTNE